MLQAGKPHWQVVGLKTIQADMCQVAVSYPLLWPKSEKLSSSLSSLGSKTGQSTSLFARLTRAIPINLSSVANARLRTTHGAVSLSVCKETLLLLANSPLGNSNTLLPACLAEHLRHVSWVQS